MYSFHFMIHYINTWLSHHIYWLVKKKRILTCVTSAVGLSTNPWYAKWASCVTLDWGKMSNKKKGKKEGGKSK